MRGSRSLPIQRWRRSHLRLRTVEVEFAGRKA